MKGSLQFAAVALLALGLWPAAHAEPKQPKGANAKAAKGGQKGVPRAEGNVKAIETFRNMSPEQRQKALAKLPPDRQKAIQERLAQYDKMTPEQRKALHQSLQNWNNLPPERQAAVRRLYNRVPPERRQAISQEFQTLRSMPEAARRARLNSDEFRSKYSVQERQTLQDLSKVLPE